jgi:hypothetical protein
MHRDGVDYVLVLMVQRRNIDSGTTMIGDDEQGFFDSFTLTEPFDAALVNDRRVFHGVTAVKAHDTTKPAYRDVLVVTFVRKNARKWSGPGLRRASSSSQSMKACAAARGRRCAGCTMK